MASSPQAEQHVTAPPRSTSRGKRSREEMFAIFRAARDEVQAANPQKRDLLAELIRERRAAAVHE